MNTLASDAVEGPVTVHHSDDELRHLVEHAAHFLPAQGPIEVFVHHNTLHAFEQEPFSQAVISGMKRFDAQPYFSEKEYRRLFTQGRITRDDLEAVLAEDLGPGAHDAFHGLGSRFEIRMSMLLHPLHIGPDAELRWIVAETDAFERFQPGISAESRQQLLNASRDWMRAHQENASHSGSELTESLDRYGAHFTDWKDSAWESFTLHLLWRICLAGTGVEQESRSSRQFIRRRDLFLRATGEDVDRDVHDVLIRFTAGFIDQGYCGWTLPLRDEGFFRSFCTMYANCGCVCSRSLPALGQELARILKQNVTPETSVQESLAALEIPESDWEEFIVQTLLSIRGWAGMIHQLESGVDWVVHPIPAGSLLQFLAVQLLLERFILQDISQAHLGCCEN
ncbi:MAG: DUF2309 family protein, partial [Planctomycetaceae bacterium]|nr:DUF2309 family protein [Planctomycetaceae bacterium]